MYASTHTRPDLLYANCYLAREIDAPSHSSLFATKRLLAHIKTTAHHGIVYRGKITEPKYTLLGQAFLYMGLHFLTK